MKRLIIIVEGDSEVEFVNSILLPFFHSNSIYQIDCFKIKHSKGGLNKYSHLRKDLMNVLYEDKVVVTTLIDYYALPTDFPNYQESIGIVNKEDRLSYLENAIKEDLETTQGRPFPYLVV